MMYLVRASVDLKHDSAVTLCYQSTNHVSLFSDVLTIFSNDSIEKYLDIQSLLSESPQWTI